MDYRYWLWTLDISGATRMYLGIFSIKRVWPGFFWTLEASCGSFHYITNLKWCSQHVLGTQCLANYEKLIYIMVQKPAIIKISIIKVLYGLYLKIHQRTNSIPQQWSDFERYLDSKGLSLTNIFFMPIIFFIFHPINLLCAAYIVPNSHVFPTMCLDGLYSS